jgi:hypothetical protein
MAAIDLIRTFDLPATAAAPFAVRLRDLDDTVVEPLAAAIITHRGNGLVRVRIRTDNTFVGSLAIWSNGANPDSTPPSDEVGIDAAPLATEPMESNVGIGTGNIPVNHVYPGAGLIKRNGIPVDNCEIKFYLKGEFQSGLRTLRATTFSNSYGEWVESVMLDPAEYAVVVYDPATNWTTQFELDVVAA